MKKITPEIVEMMGLVVTVVQLKGGVGKSTVSAILSTFCGFPIVTNDFWSPLLKVFNSGDKKRMLAVGEGKALPNLPVEFPRIYDAGGYADERLTKMIELSDCVVVPTYTTKNDIETMLQTLKQVSQHTSNVIVVANKAKKGDRDGLKNLLESFPAYANYDVVELSDAPIYVKVLNQATCITEIKAALVAKWKFLNKTVYRAQIKQVEILVGTILSYQYPLKAA